MRCLVTNDSPPLMGLSSLITILVEFHPLSCKKQRLVAICDYPNHLEILVSGDDGYHVFIQWYFMRILCTMVINPQRNKDSVRLSSVSDTIKYGKNSSFHKILTVAV